MLLSILAIILGFILLIWSADRFVDGAAATAKYAGLSPLLIGMLVIGFGTSAPEMLVSALAAIDGNPNLALGNAIGSNIVNTSLILGTTAIISPILVQSSIIKKELPLLLAVVALSGLLMWDGQLTRVDSILLLIAFIAFILWSIKTSKNQQDPHLEADVEHEIPAAKTSLKFNLWLLISGLVLLIVSSRMLVWGAVEIATQLGVSDLIIGLTIVALGTSLPELASSVVSARKGEHDLALGNIIGSNIFNILAVIGIAGTIAPLENLTAEIMTRDWPVMLGLTIGLFFMCIGFKKAGRINRLEGSVLLSAYVLYSGVLIVQTTI